MTEKGKSVKMGKLPIVQKETCITLLHELDRFKAGDIYRKLNTLVKEENPQIFLFILKFLQHANETEDARMMGTIACLMIYKMLHNQVEIDEMEKVW